MDKEMIDRVAKAMYEDYRASFAIVDMPSWEDCKYDKSAFLSYAKQAIKAMREPTQKMLDSIRHMEVNSEYNISSEIEDGYTTMIDAVIND